MPNKLPPALDPDSFTVIGEFTNEHLQNLAQLLIDLDAAEEESQEPPVAK